MTNYEIIKKFFNLRWFWCVFFNFFLVIKITDPNEGKELDSIKQVAYQVDEDKKGPLLRHLIKSKKLKQVLVFASSLYKADNIADKLRKNGMRQTLILA